MSNNKKKKNEIKDNKKIERITNLSDDEQLFIYADIIANYIVNEIHYFPLFTSTSKCKKIAETFGGASKYNFEIYITK